MRFWRKSKSRLTGVNVGIPPFSAGATWDKDADELADAHRQLNILLIRKAPALEPADVELAKAFFGESAQ